LRAQTQSLGRGAKIEVAAMQLVRKRLYQAVPRDRLSYDAALVWREGGETGMNLPDA
jgi:hypothetical protein